MPMTLASRALSIWPKLLAFSAMAKNPAQAILDSRRKRSEAARAASAHIAAGDVFALRATLAPWRLPLARLAGDREEKETLMGDAAAYGQIECAEALLEYGRSLNARDYWEMTPLDRALENGRVDFARWAIERGAKVAFPKKPDEASPIYYAAKGGQAEAVELIANALPDPARARAMALRDLCANARDDKVRAALAELLSRPQWLDALPAADQFSLKSKDKAEPLLALAVAEGEDAEPSARLLLGLLDRICPDPERRAEALAASLKAAVRLNAESHSQALLQTLWSQSTRALSAAEIREMFFSSTRSGNSQALEWLLSRASTPDLTESLELAAHALEKIANPKVAPMWLDRLDLTDERVWRPLLKAATQSGRLEPLMALAQKGVPLDSPLPGELPPLECLAYQSDGPALPWLLGQLQISDPKRLRDLADLVEKLGSAYGGSGHEALGLIAIMAQRAELSASAPEAPASRSALRL